MLPINFAASRSRFPGLTPVFDALGDWFRTHPYLRHFEVGPFRQSHPEIGLPQLVVALAALVEDDVLSRKVAVVAPTNYSLALDEDGKRTALYESEEEIPDELYDTSLTPFQTDEGDSVPVYAEAHP